VVQDRETSFDAETGRFTFTMVDDLGKMEEVVYDGAKPNNFEIADAIVVKGRFSDGAFHAEDILTKCRRSTRALPSRFRKRSKPRRRGRARGGAFTDTASSDIVLFHNYGYAMTGTILVRFAFLATLCAGGLYFYSRRRDDAQKLQLARYSFQLSVLLVLSFCLYLLYLILTHQFQYTYVWNYSATTLPTPLLVSTFYAGQEGSFSLWTLYTAVLGIFLLSYTARRNYEKEVMMIWCLIQASLLTMLIIKNPFAMIWDSFPAELVHTGPLAAGAANTVWLDKAKGIWAQFPAEGKGLNPLLQNYWMVIHPQILFSGFTAMAVPYAFALAGLIKRDYSGWIRTAKPWIVYSAAMLGTGIILGGYWAYETLGWGGYWGWDPVENSSLIPWLVSVAAIHTFMSQNQSGTYVRTNLVLAMACFLMVMYSTFLTRSGVLGRPPCTRSWIPGCGRTGSSSGSSFSSRGSGARCSPAGGGRSPW